MFSMDKAVVAIVDVQGALAQFMFERGRLFANLARLVKGGKVLGLPVLWVEQNPRHLGPTLPELAELLAPAQPMAKMSFSCCGCTAFMDALRSFGRKQVIVAGIETHVCIYQTARELIELGFEVEVVGDATSSRAPENHALGLDRIRQCNAGVTTVETILLELLRTAEVPQFKDILRLIK